MASVVSTVALAGQVSVCEFSHQPTDYSFISNGQGQDKVLTASLGCSIYSSSVIGRQRWDCRAEMACCVS